MARSPALLLLLALAASPAGAATASLVADVSAATPPFHLYDFGQHQLTAVGSRIVFESHDPSVGFGLWGSDGTDAGTELLASCASCNDRGVRVLGTIGGVAYFTLDSGDAELWRTDGTREGTLDLGVELGLYSVVGLGAKKLFFTECPDIDPCQLWTSDGTVAGTIALATDLPDRTYGAPHDLRALGDEVYLVANAGDGYQLWVSDGTPAGTRRQRSFSVAEKPQGFAAVGGRLLYFLSDGSGMKLWASVGVAGVPSVVAQLPPRSALASTIVAGAALRFVVQNAAGGFDLWTSDGTSAGTRRLTDFGAANRFPYASGPGQMAAIGGRLLFFTVDLEGNLGLWASGGTAQTTGPLAGCAGGCPTFPEYPVLRQLPYFVPVAGGRVVFTAVDDTGSRLWVSDGTGAGTRVVRTLCSGSCVLDESLLTGALGQALFFGDAAGGAALFASDGTPAGTRRLAAGGAIASATDFEAAGAGGKIFFSGIADAAQGPQLWVSDGTAQGTGEVTLLGNDGPSSDPASLVGFQGGLLWTAYDDHGLGVWTTGAGRPARLTPSDVEPASPLVVAGTFAFFAVGESFAPQELWRTDGTAAGTVELAALPGPIGALAAFAGRLFFAAPSGDRAAVWSSDGTSAGTAPAVVLPAGVGSVGALYAVGGRLFLAVADSRGTALWVSDGTSAGTRALTPAAPFHVDSMPWLTAVGPAVFFAAFPSNDGSELWKTDGTAAGTVAVLPATVDGYGANPADLVAFGGALYFTAGGERFGQRRGLWRSDGTAAGTIPLKLFTGTPADLTVVDDRLFFTAADGVHGRELWVTDGTAAGTVLVRDIAPGAASAGPAGLVAAGGLLYFTANDGAHGAELWQSDGTAAGTRLVEDLAPGALSSSPGTPVVSGDELYFAADDGIFGRELWAYPLAAGAPGCSPSDTVLCLAGGRFRVEAHWEDLKGGGGPGHAAAVTGDTGTFWFFSAANVEAIVKVLDGTGLNHHFWVFYGALSDVAYTITVTDTATGAVRRYSNPPGHLASVGDTEAFGPHGATGSAPAALAGGEAGPAAGVAGRASPVPCVAGLSRLCLNGGRFAVEARWKDFQGRTGTGTAVPLSGDTGYFWFFSPGNVEVVAKVLDGRPVNGKFWVFYGALSNVEYTLTVTDTATGAMRTYTNPSGHFGSVADTGAF